MGENLPVNAKLFLFFDSSIPVGCFFDKQLVSSAFNNCNFNVLKNKTKWQVVECK